jgi:dynein heavy chain
MPDGIGELKRIKLIHVKLQGELTITEEMETLESCLYMDQVPPNWTKRAYPSMLTLGPWFADLILRLRELEAWSMDFSVSIAQSV